MQRILNVLINSEELEVPRSEKTLQHNISPSCRTKMDNSLIWEQTAKLYQTSEDFHKSTAEPTEE